MGMYNGFPMNYSPQMPQQFMTQPQSQAQNNPMIWVQGETGAKSYLLAPNTTLPLWDSESQTIYLKSSDASGMPSMKILDYTVRQQQQSPNRNVIEESKQSVDFVTHDELKNLEEKMLHKIDEIVKESVGA